MTFYPGEREKKVRYHVRIILTGTYTLETITDWLARRDTNLSSAHPKTEEEESWAWEEVRAIEKERPNLIRRPPQEPAEMLEYDEVAG